MQARNYVAPSSIDEAVAALQAGNGANGAFAGGTDVIIQVRENRRAVDTLVDI
ncbi:MAG: FAD binding domain-containing protein, partial [Dehalococcoidia bacterium]|nr:FAD binding domain-containing protein [Dehalococcoidia bacterium]